MNNNQKYDDLMRALVPRQPHNPQYGHQPAGQPQQPMVVYPGQPYQPTPYYMGNAPIQYPPQYPVDPYPRQDPVEPWPPMPPRQPQPRKSGPSGLDLAVVIFVAAMALIFLAAALPQ